MTRKRWLLLATGIGVLAILLMIVIVVYDPSWGHKTLEGPVAVVKGDHLTEGAFDSAASPDAVVSTLRAGMSEEVVRKSMSKVALDSGTVYWGGSGARRIYFALPENRQIWVEFAGASGGFKVVEVGHIEPKRPWIRHNRDSITVE